MHELVYNSYIDSSKEFQPQPVPNLTLCSWQPVSCKCPLFYSKLVLDNLEYTYPLLSLACPLALDKGFFPGYPFKLTDSELQLRGGQPGVTYALASELGIDDTTITQILGGNTAADFILSPLQGLGAKTFCPVSKWQSQPDLTRGLYGQSGFGVCTENASRQADLPTWRQTVKATLSTWYAQQNVSKWACAQLDNDPQRQAAETALQDTISAAVAAQKEVALNMADLYTYSQHGNMFVGLEFNQRTCGLASSADNHCGNLTVDRDGVDGAALMPLWQSPARRIDPTRGVCQTLNMDAFTPRAGFGASEAANAIEIYGYIDQHHGTLAQQFQFNKFGYGRVAAIVRVQGAEPDLRNDVVISGGESVEVKVRKVLRTRKPYPYPTDCIQEVGGVAVQQRETCRARCIHEAHARLCAQPSSSSEGGLQARQRLYTGAECSDPHNWTSCIAPVAYPEYWGTAAPPYLGSCSALVRQAAATSTFFPDAGLADGIAACADATLDKDNAIVFRYGETGDTAAEQASKVAQGYAYCPPPCSTTEFAIERQSKTNVLVNNPW
jgi:hypothetical protein